MTEELNQRGLIWGGVHPPPSDRQKQKD